MTPHEELVSAINATEFSIHRIEGMFKQFNSSEWPDSLRGPIELAREYLAINRVMPTPSVAEDYVNLAGILNQIEWPVASGSDLEADARLFDLQDRTGRLILDCVAIVAAAREMGIGYSQPESIHPDGLRVPKTGYARALDRISREVDDLEFHIEKLGSEEGTSDQSSRQQVLVIRYRNAASRSIQTIRVAVKTGTAIALDVIQRASASLVITTKQFAATIQATSSNASPRLRKAVSALRQPVQTVARSIGALIKQVAAQAAIRPTPLPEDFAEQAHAMILAGIAPPATWVPRLVKLDFSGTALTDLAPLANLSAVESLNLNNTHVSDISPLASLSALQSLDMRDTQVRDISALASLPALQCLDFSGTQVIDVIPLANIPSLQHLHLRGTQVSDITPLASLSGLKSLTLWDTKVSNVSPLADLTELQHLNLWDTKVSDVGPLAGLAALQHLNLWNTRVSDVGPLAGLTALQHLNLWNTPVSDIGPLASLTALENLNLARAQVIDIGPLASLTALQSLSLYGTQVSDVSPLANLSALQRLTLMDTRVNDVAPLIALSSLQSLDLMNTEISDISPLANLVSLEELDLSYTQVRDISPLASLPALNSLDLEHTRVSDVSPLASLSALKNLALDRTPVSDINNLSGLASLKITVETKLRATALKATLHANSSVKVTG